MKPLGILVFGHRRPSLLWNVLESLRRQGMLGCTHVWIDGFSHAPELAPKVRAVRELALEFRVASWVNCNGRLGIEKLMLDGLTEMARHYRDIIVLEDDCFPSADAIRMFTDELERVRDDAGIYSVYGNPFGVEGEGEVFPRFQGWGWATTRDKLMPVLAQLKSMFMMSEPEYLAWTKRMLTPEMRQTLNVTASRDVTAVLGNQFSWDSATTLLTAILGMKHRRTPHRVIYNCGAGEDAGHFRGKVDAYRAPPFNMIGADEAWQFFNQPLEERYRGKTWFGLDELDRKLSEFITTDGPGRFIELGAFDGLAQTNTLWLERRGWRGLLVEAVHEYAQQCKLNRPLSTVVHAACVAPDHPGSEVELHEAGLMSLVEGARDPASQEEWLSRAERVQGIARGRSTAPARTLSSILDETGFGACDLLCLDVEGYEQQVLAGLDLPRHAPTWLLAEDSRNGDLVALIERLGYELVSVLNERPFTRDVLFRWRAARF
jgi:FkbM family methyltransferase